MIHKYIAERKLFYSHKGSAEKNAFVIRISLPFEVNQSMVDHPVAQDYSGCHIQIDGLPEIYPDVYGADSIQALNLATNLEAFLRRLQKKYDLFWASGEPYFEE